MSGPYNYLHNKDINSYTFITVHGIEYFVYLADGSHYFEKYPQFAAYVIMFGFYTNPVKNIPADKNVRITITQIITNYFIANEDKILLFVCEQGDGKQFFRMKKFNGWFTLAGNLKIVKTDLEIPFDNGFTYLSVLYHKRNIHANEIEKALQNFEQDFLK